MTIKSKTNLKIGAVIVALIAVMGLLYSLYINYIDKPVEGIKNIVVKVVTKPDTLDEFKIETDSEFLSEALIEKNIIQGSEGPHGFFIEKVNNISADTQNQEWWCITKDGKEVTTGVSSTPIYDGDTFELTLTVGW